MLSQVGRLMHGSCCSVGAGMAPDEFIIITALKRWGYVRSVRRVDLQPGMRHRPGTLINSYPTFVVFPAESSPHPVLWTQLERKVMCQVCLALNFVLSDSQAGSSRMPLQCVQ
jgi:hypothetical protein